LTGTDGALDAADCGPFGDAEFVGDGLVGPSGGVEAGGFGVAFGAVDGAGELALAVASLEVIVVAWLGHDGHLLYGVPLNRRADSYSVFDSCVMGVPGYGVRPGRPVGVCLQVEAEGLPGAAPQGHVEDASGRGQ
jgi:hypothetical protein